MLQHPARAGQSIEDRHPIAQNYSDAIRRATCRPLRGKGTPRFLTGRNWKSSVHFNLWNLAHQISLKNGASVVPVQGSDFGPDFFSGRRYLATPAYDWRGLLGYWQRRFCGRARPFGLGHWRSYPSTRSADPVQPSASCRPAWDRLPLLPHIGCRRPARRPAADPHLHDVPFADLDWRSDVGARARQPGR